MVTKVNSAQKGQKPSPIPLKNKNPLCLARDLEKFSYIKGIPKPAFQTQKASMTVEAALLIPLFLVFFLQLMSAVEMVRLHGNIHAALWENGRLVTLAEHTRTYDQSQEGQLQEGQPQEGQMQELEAAKEGENAVFQMGKTILTELGMKTLLVQELGTAYLDASPMTYGAEGLQLWESSLQGNVIDVRVTYQVSPFLQMPGLKSFRMANRYYARAWTGYDVTGNTGDENGMVYVTTYGEVYHEKVDCSHINRQIRTIRAAETGEVTNQYGALYTACELCLGTATPNPAMHSSAIHSPAIPTEVRYVTEEGQKYHGEISCPTLKRTVSGIPKQEAVKKYRPCKSCTAG